MLLMPETDQQTLITVESPQPHSFKQQMITEFFLHPGVEELVVACGTKFGKTLAASDAITKANLNGRAKRFRWLAPYYHQTKFGLEYCQKLHPPEPYSNYRKGERILEVPSLDNQLQFYHTQNPVALEGAAIHGYVFDEAAKMHPDAYSSAMTTRTRTGGPMLIISTPFGKGWFYDCAMRARQEMEDAFRAGRPPTKLFITAKTADNPTISRHIIEDSRKRMPERLFRMLYLAEFLDDANVFLGFRDCFVTDKIVIHDSHQRWFSPEAEKSQVVIGADWAKTVDYTVFIAIDIVTRKVVGFERFHKKKYTEAIRQLVRFSKKFNEVLTVYHDKTGVGVPIDDQLSYTSLPYEGIVFSNTSKSDMVNGTITEIEQGNLGLPRWDVLEKELDAFEVQTNALGRMQYNAPQGQHDDVVCALILAVAALDRYAETDCDIRWAEELGEDIMEPSALESYYNDDEDY